MVEVLRRGEKPEDRIYSATCFQCKSLLRFKRSEAKYHDDQRDGDFLSVTCPVCSGVVNANVNAYQKDAPTDVPYYNR